MTTAGMAAEADALERMSRHDIAFPRRSPSYPQRF